MTSDLSSFRRAVQLRDRCRDAAIAASQRFDVPMSPTQANVAFDAMVDLVRKHHQGGSPADAAVEQIRQIRRLLIGQRAVGNLATLTAIQSVVWPGDEQPDTDSAPKLGGDL